MCSPTTSAGAPARRLEPAGQGHVLVSLVWPASSASRIASLARVRLRSSRLEMAAIKP
jgi:hypothetical protein